MTLSQDSLMSDLFSRILDLSAATQKFFEKVGSSSDAD